LLDLIGAVGLAVLVGYQLVRFRFRQPVATSQ
jgi:hypothetical protein